MAKLSDGHLDINLTSEISQTQMLKYTCIIVHQTVDDGPK